VVALPLMVIGSVVNEVAGAGKTSPMLLGVTVLFVVILSALVTTFLMLMRSGYRWARSLLTGGGVASIIFTVTNLFTPDRPTLVAVIFAITGIVGSVLIGGGIVLVHRKDAQGFFTR
jgi:Mn2+/Fe2+ NRAMP family transporter